MTTAQVAIVALLSFALGAACAIIGWRPVWSWVRRTARRQADHVAAHWFNILVRWGTFYGMVYLVRPAGGAQVLGFIVLLALHQMGVTDAAQREKTPTQAAA